MTEQERNGRIADTPTSDSVASLELLVIGFAPTERRLLEGIAKFSQRRRPRIDLMLDYASKTPDVVMIDGHDPAAMQWAAAQQWLARTVVIWVDASEVPPGHTLVQRPVQWTNLPMLLARALEQDQSRQSTAQAVSPPVTQFGAAPVQTAPNAPLRDHTNPFRPSPELSATPVKPTELPTQRPVLIVDDSLPVRAYMRSQLEARGLKVSEAESAEAAIAATSITSFACVFMDVLMPGMDGYEACRRIKAQLRTSGGVPIIMLTSKSSPFDRIRGKMAGCDAYLTKPVNPEQLQEILLRYTSRPATSNSAALSPGRFATL